MSAQGLCATIMATALVDAARQDSESAFPSGVLGVHTSNLLRTWAEQLSAANASDELHSSDAAVAAIKYALENHTEEPMIFLRLWNEGEFDAVRREWKNVPDEVFIGADSLFKPSKNVLALQAPEGNSDPLLQASTSPPATWLTADMVAAGLRAQSDATAQGSSPAAALSCAFKAMLKTGETATEGPWPAISGNDLLAWYSLWLSQPSMLPPFVIDAMFQRLKQLLEEVGMLRQSHDEQLVLRATAYRHIEAIEARIERAGSLLSEACTGDLDPTAVDAWMSEFEPASAELVFGRAATEAQAERLRLQETLTGHELWNAGATVAVQQLIFGAISHLGKSVGDQPDSARSDENPKPSRAELIQGLAFALYAVDVLDASSAPAPLDHIALEALLTSLRREHTDAVTIPRHRFDALLLNGQQREVEVYERVRQMAAYYEAPEGFHAWIDLMQNLAREGLAPAGKGK